MGKKAKQEKTRKIGEAIKIQPKTGREEEEAVTYKVQMERDRV